MISEVPRSGIMDNKLVGNPSPEGIAMGVNASDPVNDKTGAGWG